MLIKDKPENKRLSFGLRRIADRLFYARIMAKLSREEVAKIRNVSVNTVRRWETRKSTPKNQKLIMGLAEIYNISYLWLAFRYGDEKDDFASGIELYKLQNIWDKLSQEQQLKAIAYIQKLADDSN